MEQHEKRFAVISNGVVTNIVVGVEPEVIAANPNMYIEYTNDNPAAIGDKFEETPTKTVK